MKKFVQQSFTLILLGIMFLSCEEESIDNSNITLDNNTELESVQEKYRVTLEDASLIAETIEFKRNGVALKNGNDRTTRRLLNTFSVPDQRDRDAFHIMNYRDGGFIILSADRRTEPVLAFSDSNSFEKSAEIPPALKAWLIDTSLYINSIRTNLVPAPQLNPRAWDKCSIEYAVGARYDDCENNCENTYIYKGPYIKTLWGQGEKGFPPYNQSLEDGGCEITSNGKYPTGCVATTIAQIAKHYKPTSNYNWNAMPLNNSNIHIGNLMKDIGESVNMNYSCSESFTGFGDLVQGLKSYGFSSVQSQNYNYSKVKQELSNGNAVILSALSKKEKGCKSWVPSWLCNLFKEPNYKGGHVWICDGYISSFYCSTGTSYLKFHMNWGLSGKYNGYYSFNGSWEPGGNGVSFIYNQKMVYNFN